MRGYSAAAFVVRDALGLGARELLDVKASTSREMMYGSILYTDPGMPSDMRKPKPKYTFDSARNRPNSSAASAMRPGFH